MTNKNQVATNLNEMLDEAKFSKLHLYVWILAAMGIFLEGYCIFSIGVALPLIRNNFELVYWQLGLSGVSTLLGAAIGSLISGRLADIFGRRFFFTFNMLIAVVGALLSGLSSDVYMLSICQFIVGYAAGSDYPIAASYVTELMPSHLRGRLLIAAFSFQSVGMIFAALIGIGIMLMLPDQIFSWRLYLTFLALPAVIVLFLRSYVPESPRWLLLQGRVHDAAKIIRKYVPYKMKVIERILIEEQEYQETLIKKHGQCYHELLTPKYIWRTILVTIPWFLMDVATYGIGIFTPLIITDIVSKGAHSGQHNIFSNVMLSTEGSAFVDLFLLGGFIVNILLVEKVGRIRLQIIGFIGMAIGLVILSNALGADGKPQAAMWVIFSGFITFNLLMNAGPNSTTFMMPVEIFPTEMRGTIHGLAAFCSKIGAVSGVFFLPMVMHWMGIKNMLYGIAVICLAASGLTLLCRIFIGSEPFQKAPLKSQPAKAS